MAIGFWSASDGSKLHRRCSSIKSRIRTCANSNVALAVSCALTSMSFRYSELFGVESIPAEWLAMAINWATCMSDSCAGANRGMWKLLGGSGADSCTFDIFREGFLGVANEAEGLESFDFHEQAPDVLIPTGESALNVHYRFGVVGLDALIPESPPTIRA